MKAASTTSPHCSAASMRGSSQCPYIRPGASRPSLISSPSAANARPATVITTPSLRSVIQPLLADCPHLAPSAWRTTTVIPPGASGGSEPAIDGQTPALLQYTSGSTGDPRGVVLTHQNLLHNQQVMQETFGVAEDSVIVSWLPLYHDMGLIGAALHPVFAGAQCHLMPPSAFLPRPHCDGCKLSRFTKRRFPEAPISPTISASTKSSQPSRRPGPESLDGTASSPCRACMSLQNWPNAFARASSKFCASSMIAKQSRFSAMLSKRCPVSGVFCARPAPLFYFAFAIRAWPDGKASQPRHNGRARRDTAD